MRSIAIVALIMLTGCTAAIKLPGTRDSHTEQIQALVKAIEKQSDAIMAISGKATPTPTPEPSPTPTPGIQPTVRDSYGEEPLIVIASRRIK